MRLFVSREWLLLQLIIGLLSASVVTSVLCKKLDEQNYLVEMDGCEEGVFAFASSTNPVFDLSTLDQTTADKILYKQKSNTDLSPDPNNPKLFEGHVKISSSKLERLTLGINSLGEPQKVEIIGNVNLNLLKLHLEPGSRANVTLILKGNKQLSMASIKRLKKVPQLHQTASEIQEYHECFFFNKAITDLSQLVECSVVTGDLIIDGNTNIPATMPVLRVKKIKNGCVKIENSALPNLDFLQGLLKNKATCPSGKHLLKKNNQLCLTSAQQKDWTDANFDVDYTGKCRDQCTVDFAQKNPISTNPRAKCQVVTGDVVISGSGVTLASLADWDRVEELHGTIEVDGTDLDNITIFNNLKNISNPSPGKIGISVTKNMKMKTFAIPQLVELYMPPGAWSDGVYFATNNETFMFTEAEGDKWREIVKKGSLNIPIYIPPKPTSTTPTPAPPPTTTLNNRAHKMQQVANREKWGIGIGFAVGCLLSALASVLIIYCGKAVTWLKDKVKGKAEDEDVQRKVQIPLNMADAKSRMDSMILKKVVLEEDIKTEADPEVEVNQKFTDNEYTFMEEHLATVDEKRYTTRCEALRNMAKQVPWKAPYIHSVDSIDVEKIKKVPLPKMKSKARLFRHEVEMTTRFVNYELIPNIEKPNINLDNYDELKMLALLLSGTLDMGMFFYKNHKLIEKILTGLQGDHYQKGPLAIVEGPVLVVGDIHGSIRDFLILLNMDPDDLAKKNGVHPCFCYRWVFLGDYLDRGKFSLDVFILASLLAKLFPERFVMLRGNHETLISSGDEGNLVDQMGPELYELGVPNAFFVAEYIFWEMRKVLHHFPMAALINEKVFCMHGGPTLPALRGDFKTIRDMFSREKVPWPFISYDENFYRRIRMRTLQNVYAGFFVPEFEDKYTEAFKKGQDIFKMENLRRKKMTKAEEQKDPVFTNQYPNLTAGAWSDPSPTFSHRANVRNTGNSVGPQHNVALKVKFDLDAIMRGHEEKLWFSMFLGLLWSLYSNNDTAASAVEMAQMKSETNVKRQSGILQIRSDNTLHLALYSWSPDKKADMDFLPVDMNLKRQLGGNYVNERHNTKEKQEKRNKDRKKVITDKRATILKEMIMKNPKVGEAMKMAGKEDKKAKK